VIERFTFDRLQTTLLFLAIATAACLMPAQHDTWWLLRAGHDMWAAGRVLLTDTFSHTVDGAFWPNHEWLSEMLFYGVYAIGGLPLLTLASALVVTTAWAIVWAQTPGPPRAKFLLTAFVIASASTTWSLRAQVLSLLLVTITMALLRRRRYVWLPVVFFFWANLHGAVLLGVLLLGAALVAALVEDVDALPRLVLVSALCVLATSLTPLGWQFWLDMPRSLGRIRQLGIDEWTAPRFASLSLLPFWVTIAALIALAATRGRALLRDPTARRDGQITMCACALVLVPLALTAVRNVPPFLMLAVPAIAALFPRVPLLTRSRSTSRPWLNCAIATAAALVAATVVTSAYAMRPVRLHWTPLPAASITALNGCHGNIYNRYDEGGYLIWFAPGRKVFLDGRQDPYPPSLIKEQLRVESSGDFESLFRHYDVRCAYVPAASRLTAGLLRAGWTPLFRDSDWTVLARDHQGGD
jgi:hypothetical protein